jgi:hypothetical protein
MRQNKTHATGRDGHSQDACLDAVSATKAEETPYTQCCLVSVKATPNDVAANGTMQYVGHSLSHDNEAMQVVSTPVSTKIGAHTHPRSSPARAHTHTHTQSPPGAAAVVDLQDYPL